MHVISLVSDPKNFIDKNTGIFVKGQMYEDYEQDTSSDRPTYEKWDPENPTNYNQSGRDWEREVTMQVFKDGALKYSTNVGLRVSGNATRSYRQKSLNLYARKEYGDKKIKYPFFSGLIDVNGKAIDSFDKLTLRNGGNDFEDARIRDDIVHEAVGKQSNPDDNLNVGTLAKADTIVFIDGEFWGYYSLQEKLDEEYVDSHYDIKADDVTVYKCGDDYEGNEIIEAYNTFAIEAAEADMTVEANYTKFCNTVDINSFIDYVAVQAYIGNYDWANEVGTNNWFLWRSNEVDAENPYADTKWRFALYDTEFAMARYNDGKDNVDSNFFNIIKKCEVPGNLGAIFLKLMEREDFKKQFTDRFDQIAKTNFNATSIKDAIDARTGRLATAIGWTNRRFGINSMNQDNMNRLKDFFTNRYDKIKKYLDGIHGVEERPLLDTPIELYTSTGQTFDEYTNDFCELSKATNGFTMEVITPGEERHSIQVVVAHDLQLEFGAQYKFSYKMVYEGTNGGNQPGMSGNVMQGGGNYTVFGTHEHTSNEGTDITEIFDMSQDDLGIRISFDFWEKGKYTITDIKLEQIR